MPRARPGGRPPRAVASARDRARWETFGDFEHGGLSSCALEAGGDARDALDAVDGASDGASTSGMHDTSRREALMRSYASLVGTIDCGVPSSASSRLKRSGFAGARTKPLEKTLMNPDPAMDFDAFERGANQNNINTTDNNNNNNNSAANSPILGMRVKNDENGNEVVVNASDKSFDFEAKEKSVPAHLPLAENTNTRPDDASAIGLSNDEIPARASGRAKSPPTSPSLPGNSGGGSSFTPASKFTSLGSEINENESSAPQTIEEEETLQLSSSEERDLEPMLALFSADVVAKLIFPSADNFVVGSVAKKVASRQ